MAVGERVEFGRLRDGQCESRHVQELMSDPQGVGVDRVGNGDHRALRGNDLAEFRTTHYRAKWQRRSGAKIRRSGRIGGTKFNKYAGASHRDGVFGPGTGDAPLDDMRLATAEKPPNSHEPPADVQAVQGEVRPGYEAIREAFADNFTKRGELGAACCIYHRGEKVVDLWGGIRNKDTCEPWERDTMVLVYSATKGLSAMVMALAHSRGWVDYEECVCRYWPEFAQQGKQRITVRQLLSHQAGLYALSEPLDRALVADLDRLALVLARQRPAWKPGTRQAYHAITLGFYEGELLRRVDRQHRSLGQFFQDEIASPLGLDLFIRLPETIPNSRLATLARPTIIEMLRGFGPRFMLEAMNPRSNINRALRGSELAHDETRIYARNLEIPSGGGVGTARAIAGAYSVFATGGRELGLRSATLDLLAAPAAAPKRGFHDECMKSDDVQFSLGFMKSTPGWPFGDASSYGAPGSGGALGFADPRAGIGYAYVTSQMGTTLTGDPRDVALRNSLYAVI